MHSMIRQLRLLKNSMPHRLRRADGSALLMVIAGLSGCVAPPRIITVSWTPPATYVDGSPLSENDIAGYKLQCAHMKRAGTNKACGLPELMVASEHNSTPVNIAGVPRQGGTYCFKAATVTKSNEMSKWTDEVCKTFAPL